MKEDLKKFYEIIKDKDFTDEEIKKLQESFYNMLNDKCYMTKDFELDYVESEEK